MTSTESVAAIAGDFAQVAPACDHWSARVVRQRRESLSVTRGVPDPVHVGDDIGVMITVTVGDGMAYGATSDITPSGLARAGAEARAWAVRAAGRMVSPPPIKKPPRSASIMRPSPSNPGHRSRVQTNSRV